MTWDRPNSNLRNLIGEAYVSPRQPSEIVKNLNDMAGDAWRERGYVCVHIDDFNDNDLLMKSIEARMNRKYGERV